MYLSKLILNLSNYDVQKDLADFYRLHQRIMFGFPNDIQEDLKTSNYKDGRILFCLDMNKRLGIVQLIIQSPVIPNWDHLINDERYLSQDPVFKQFKYPTFKKKQSYWFKLYANPTVKKEGKRHFLYKDTDQFEWLKKKASKGGFSIISSQVLAKRKIKGKKKTKNGGHTITIDTVIFEGILVVNEPDKFERTIKLGIGSAKGFGCGFLTIKKT